jgi:predicted ester cyclase
VSLLRSKKRALKKQRPQDVDPESDEGIVGIYFEILGEIEGAFTKAAAVHLEHLHEPGGMAREKADHDFMDLGMRMDYLDALDSIEFSIENSIVAPNLGLRKRGIAHVVTRWTTRGIHNRPLMGIPPSGEQVTIAGMTFSTFRNYNIRVDYTYWEMPELTRRMVER